MTQARYSHEALLRFARDLLVKAGLDAEKASAVADVLAEACRATPPRAVQLERGIALHPSAVAGVRPWSEKLHVVLPQPLQ
jgi:hypothetical protein